MNGIQQMQLCSQKILYGLSLLLLFTACKDVTEYSTGVDESYCGNVIQGPFVRAGLGPSVRMRLTFNADLLDSLPGSISTSDGLLKDAPLRAVPPIFHDSLSSLNFGEGRRRNLIYSASSSRSAFVVILSLMESGTAEVRLLRAASTSHDPSVPSEDVLFGVFPLEKRKGTCGL